MLKKQIPVFLVIICISFVTCQKCDDKNAEPRDCAVDKCSPTCQDPDQYNCQEECKPLGCQCKPGFILSKAGGTCIPVDTCPGGDPCGVNATFAYCAPGCPNNYCPKDDSRGYIACGIPNPCRSGCVCKENHLRKSTEDRACVATSDCSPVKCTRPNEEWNSCATNCLVQDCEFAKDAPSPCDTKYSYCQPRCICAKNHFRNAAGDCVSVEKCD